MSAKQPPARKERHAVEKTLNRDDYSKSDQSITFYNIAGSQVFDLCFFFVFLQRFLTWFCGYTNRVEKEKEITIK